MKKFYSLCIFALISISSYAELSDIVGAKVMYPIHKLTVEGTGLEDLLYHFITPYANHKETMGIKGDISHIVVTCDVPEFGIRTDTVYFSADGMVTHIGTKSNDGVMSEVTTTDIKYLGDYVQSAIENKFIESKYVGSSWQRYVWKVGMGVMGNIKSVRLTQYDGKNLSTLSKSGEEREPYKYTFTDKGKLSSVDISYYGTIKYDTNGRPQTEVLSEEAERKPFTCTYDSQGRLTKYMSYLKDWGVEGDLWIQERETTLTYNTYGALSKVVINVWNCNEKWVRQEKDEDCSQTFNITYENDLLGNWTKAKIKSSDGSTIATLTRTLTYGKLGRGKNEMTFMLGNDKLGPVKLGPVANVPKHVAEFYDEYSRETDKLENQEYLVFRKDGQVIFRSPIKEDKLYGFQVFPSKAKILSFTNVYAGCPVANILKLNLEWMNASKLPNGGAYARVKGTPYVYVIDIDNVTCGAKTPSELSDFKEGTKVKRLDYYPMY